MRPERIGAEGMSEEETRRWARLRGLLDEIGRLTAERDALRTVVVIAHDIIIDEPEAAGGWHDTDTGIDVMVSAWHDWHNDFAPRTGIDDALSGFPWGDA